MQKMRRSDYSKIVSLSELRLARHENDRELKTIMVVVVGEYETLRRRFSLGVLLVDALSSFMSMFAKFAFLRRVLLWLRVWGGK
jgi:hypothetical protein